MGKLIIIAHHAIQNNANFPSDNDLKQIGHDLRKIIARCETIGHSVDPNRDYASKPNATIHQAIVETLSEFATALRYYNINHISGIAGGQDPIAMWWERVAIPICESHYSHRQRSKDVARAAIMTEILGDHAMILHHTEDGAEINTASAYFGRAGATNVVQKYGRLYTLQIVRWLASIAFELSHQGAYKKRIEPLLGLHEPFVIFCNDDRFLLRRRTWSSYQR